MLAACVQLCSGSDRQANLDTAGRLIAAAAAQGSGMILLPENFAFMGASEADKRAAAEAEESSTVLAFLSAQAKQHEILLIGGTILLRGQDGQLRNTCPVHLPDGRLACIYDKIHLFDVALSEEQHAESALITAGGSPCTVDYAGWKLGLSVCYDLRFPELYRRYAEAGCDIMTVPSAFTVTTGEAHWRTLIRARAIENQCYVLAAGQCGTHPGNRKTWGHSMIVDPWGSVLAELDQDEGVAVAELSAAFLQDLRRRMPGLEHRRI